jgi:hypothetical protein
MNVGIDAEPHPLGLLAMLKESARPEDFVVVKIDIDNSVIEESIVHAIAADPLVLRLVDELFFEFHFFGEPEFNFGWGVRDSPGRAGTRTNATADTALHLMSKLRKRGIRAHFWV